MAPEPLKPVYWICGEDRAKVDRAVQRLIARVEGEMGMPPERFDATETAAVEVRTACEAMAFGGTRLVVVRRADQWKAADVETLIEYLADPLPTTCLALVGSGGPTPRMLRAVEAAGQVLAFGPPAKANAKERAAWFRTYVQDEVKKYGSKISPALASEVVTRAGRAGEDAGHLGNEAIKLALGAGSQGVTKDLVDALVVVDPEAKAYLLGDLITQGDARGAYGMLADLAGGSDSTHPIVIHRTLARHFRGIAVAQTPGATKADLDRLVGLKGYPADKALEQAQRLAPGIGEWCVARIADLELDLRLSELRHLGASPDDGERFVLEVAVRDLLGTCRG